MSGILLTPFAAASAAPVTAYVTGIFASGPGSSVVLSTMGVTAGDFALFGSLNSSTASSAGGAWTTIGTDGAFRYAYRPLNSTDVAGSITYSSDCIIMIWSGGIVSAAIASTGAYAGSNPVAAAGFVKNAKHAFLAAFGYSAGGAVASPSITAPATFTTRGTEILTSRSTGYDRISPTYVNNTAFSATFNSTSGLYTILELMTA